MANATISRVLSDLTVSESITTPSVVHNYAVAHYSLDQALTSATTVNVSVSGTGGATTADYDITTFQYRMGSGPWQNASNNSPITINAGFQTFDLQVKIKPDSFSETGEGVSFVVSQTAATVGITNSYWVPAQVDILDPQGQGASAYDRTITATGAIPGTEGTGTVTPAIATYHISGGGVGALDYANTQVQVSITPGLGGSTTADYELFAYRMGTSGAWLSATNNGLITIDSSATDFQLSAQVKSDNFAESAEQLLFTVSQTAGSVGLVNSWGVQNTVDLQDATGTGVDVYSRTITTGTTAAGQEGTGTVTPAQATYVISYGATGHGYAQDVVKVGILTGLGGSSAADYIANTFSYKFNTDAGWTLVSNDQITIPSTGVTSLSLRANVTSDLIAEAAEQLVFTVSQTTTGPSLTDSWWVPSTVNLLDASGTGANAVPRTVTVNNTATGVEGTTRAQANYDLLPAAGTHADGVVRVGIVGLGGASAADYASAASTTVQADWLSYSLNPNSGAPTWTSVNATGLVTITGTADSFSLRVGVTSDQLSESGEQLMFTVANTGTGSGITDSWWVPNIVNLQDAQGTGSVAFPRHITAGTPTTGMEGVDSWTTNLAPAIATFNVSRDGINQDPANYGNTQVQVRMYGAGGAAAADYSGFMYRLGTSGAWLPANNNGGLITIDASASAFQLATLALTDSNTETGEGVTFTVSQTAASIGLVDSWWVASTADLADVAAVYTVLTGGTGADKFAGTAAREMFVIAAGKSLAQTGLFDEIAGGIATGLTSGDLISVGAPVTAIAEYPGTYTEGTLLIDLAGAGNKSAAAMAVGYEVIETDLYLVINTDGGSTFNAADTLIKVVGGSGYTYNDIQWFFGVAP